MTLVAGIDSSTQSCKVTVRDLVTGRSLRQGSASHPSQTVVDPEVWWAALLTAVERAGGLADVAAISVSGQQHTPVFLDGTGKVVCDSPLWNDTGSHAAMVALNEELGREEWIRRTGIPLTLSDTAPKVRWLRDVDPAAAARTEAVAVVHDWLTWRLMGHGIGDGHLDDLVTDRSEASGTAYWSPDTGEYTRDLFEHAFGKTAVLPRILGPLERSGYTGAGIAGIPAGIPIGVGSGDNAAAALALGLAEGDAVLSLGTSGVVYARSAHPVHDYDGYVCNYADATGDHLPLVATLNAARNFEVGAALLGCSLDEFSELALQARPGASGLTLLPFFLGERTPDLPHARGTLLNASLDNLTRSNFARSVIEGTLAGQVAMLGSLAACDVPVHRLLLIGGAAASPAVQQILAEMVSIPVAVPDADEYVAKGAAMQAAGALTGVFPAWDVELRELPRAPLAARITDQHEAAKELMGYPSTRAQAAVVTSG
ncbi:FGGY family carbohydrate kinase [Herbiconiux sp. VKM Ac-2851]|uniref:FGGY family carbohydrate kinase n=1 Tax=Herbiconiux sp. VKM Ac-2851 TaxID=2739025 RepID=UPI00156701E0|nr:FGGY family carbohydrate kinase [Herbiconiux sp. VKM Ac-2851]NQX36417.1 Hsp70 family protein [Herbiconiux sp. VKM Ac-2851]